MNYKNCICIIGGGGHVGFPFTLMLASKSNFIYLYDKKVSLEKGIDRIINYI